MSLCELWSGNMQMRRVGRVYHRTVLMVYAIFNPKLAIGPPIEGTKPNDNQ